ncbi:hypothetical protein ACQQ9V_07710 [Hornefia butyriciproducens]|uniref:Uncharacterized protein n=1 Tax=Hornefia butyriciproducens TaxID=2652293 RepID=A0A6L5Y8A8_9FIRM|nr:hypothetical protein [Hornefia butyriciproducens]MCI7326150.1 hypothetical protein [Clostridiales bacterium]MST52698.1 hypothetical protein [Hornefia butyriciproducens]
MQRSKNKNEIKLYSVICPIWFLMLMPSWQSLLIFPVNYIIDTAVTFFTLPKSEKRWSFCKRHTWKVFIAGLATDLAGGLLLFPAVPVAGDTGIEWVDDAMIAIYGNPFSDYVALAVCSAAIIVAAFLTYLIDKRIFLKAGLTIRQAKKSAIILAVITAPYLFLFPSELLGT